MTGDNTIYFPPEWAPQSGVMIAWPDMFTDWATMLEDVIKVYVEISKQITRFEDLLIVCRQVDSVKSHLPDEILYRIHFFETEINDTWTRDFGPVTVLKDGQPLICDFGFNGWGDKFAWNLDNKVTQLLFKAGMFNEIIYKNMLDFILEGGSIETDGEGTLMTTSTCLLNDTRNKNLPKEHIEKTLKDTLGIKQVLWLTHGQLKGDDTDGHIDTLARFCDENTIAYVSCKDRSEEHYEELKAMESELKSLTNVRGENYRLISLPMVPAIYDDEGNRLPATFANFLIINGAVLVPVYAVKEDKDVLQILQHVFPTREIIPVNCLPLIKQHGSLHCITMQLPEGVLKTN